MADCYLSGPVQKKLGRREFVDRTCLSVKATALTPEFSGTVYYVDPNAADASDDNPGTTPARPFATVQAAINACGQHTGDVVAVMQTGAWNYDANLYRTNFIEEEVTLNKAGVRLVGVTPGGTGVLWTPASDGGTCITVTAIDCTIEGFIFSEGKTYTGCNAIYCEWDGVTLFGENLEIVHCVFVDDIDIAIQLEYAWYCHIHHNLFQECDTYGVYTDAAGSATDYTRIHDNDFIDCAIAIALLGGAGNNHIHDNRIFNSAAQNGAAATNEGINTTGGNSNLVTNNFLSCLLPVPANGDLNDLCTAAASDAWAGNMCMNGMQVTQPT